MRAIRFVVVLGLVVGAFAPMAMNIGCGTDSSSDAKKTGSLVVTGRIDSALTGAEQVDTITVNVTNTTYALFKTFTLTKDPGTGVFNGRLEGLDAVSGYQIDAIAYGNLDGGPGVTFTATALNVTIPENTDAQVTLNFHPQFPGDTKFPYYNSAPFIMSLFASKSTAEPGETLDISVTADDYDFNHKPLLYTWTADNGTVVDPHAAATQWQAPLGPGPTFTTLTVQVDDQEGGISVGTILVNAPKSAVNFSMSFIEPPSIQSMTVTGIPRPGNTVYVSATLDGGRFDFCQPGDGRYGCDGVGSFEAIWTNECFMSAGPLGMQAQQFPTYWIRNFDGTLSVSAPIQIATPNYGSCRVYVTFTDWDGSSNTGSVNLSLYQPQVTYGDEPPFGDAGPFDSGPPPFDAGPPGDGG